MQEKYTYGLWGAAVGAIALAVVGFPGAAGPPQRTAKQVSEAAVHNRTYPRLRQRRDGRPSCPGGAEGQARSGL